MEAVRRAAVADAAVLMEDGLAVPVPACALKATVLPLATDWEEGCWVMLSGLPVPLALMVSRAALLVTVPAELVAVIEYEPASEAWTLGTVRIVLVAPGMGAPAKFH